MSELTARRALAVVVWLILAVSAFADPASAQETIGRGPLVIVETDPLAFVASGYSAHLGFAAPSWDHIVLGLSVVGGLELPGVLVEANPRNAGEGWSVRINRGAGVWTHWQDLLGPVSWFIGVQLFTQEMQLETDLVPDEIDRTNLAMTALQVGLRWSPFRAQDNWLRGVYLRPWVGIGYQWIVEGTFEPGVVTPETRVGALEYDLQPTMPFATVHVGYAFGRSR